MPSPESAGISWHRTSTYVVRRRDVVLVQGGDEPRKEGKLRARRVVGSSSDLRFIAGGREAEERILEYILTLFV